MKLKITTLFLTLSLSASAQVKLAPLFTDHMVLQQQTADAPIWGEAKAGQTITVTTSWNNRSSSCTADADGRWKTTVATPAAGGPYTITISDGKKTTTLEDILIGEVWLCSGQSNMEMQVEGWGHVMNWEQEKAAATNSNIRLFTVNRATAPAPLTTLSVHRDGWVQCSPETVADFSACGYFFGRDIAKYQNVPVGLINSSWGGTLVEPWTSAKALATMPGQERTLEAVKQIPLDPADRDAAYRAQFNAWLENLNALDPGYTADEKKWFDPDFDDSAWRIVTAPGYFDPQQEDIRAFDGFIWIRRTVDIPASWAGKELAISLGRIDDNDVTFFNGQMLGATENCAVTTNYTIPAALVRQGKNTIAVRIHDTGGLLGINAEPDEMAITLKGKAPLSLNGDWRYHLSLSVNEAPQMPININNDPNQHTVLFNAMIAPLVPFAIKGAIWYQGESNSGNAYQYRELMPLMIKDWRNQWGKEFPFYLVQLANYMARQPEPVESSWAELREAQLFTRLHLDGVGMATIIDIGEADDIHPKNKQEVGRRLALAARAMTYGERIEFEGPLYSSYRIEGSQIRISFQRNTARGLRTSDGRAPKGFAICGLDHKWHWADARIETHSNGRFQTSTVVVSSPEVLFPIAVRYAWADNPDCNLVNESGLPASPFRTDEFPGLTYTVRR